MRVLISLFATTALCANLLGCDDSSGPSPQISSHLNGLVHLDGPIAGAQLQLVTLFSRDGGELLTSEGETAEDGSFTLDTHGARGPFRLVVRPPGRADVLTHYIGNFADRDALRTTAIIVTPITMLTAGLTDYYFEQAIAQSQLDGMSLDPRSTFSEALTEATAPINNHFFALDHTVTHPTRLSSTPSDTLDEPSILTGLALDGLAELARLKAQAAGVAPEGILTIDVLTEALVEDIRYDGIFNGEGAIGPVFVFNQELNSHFLRRDYALALLRFIESDRNLSRFGRADIRRYADACAGSQAVIFPQGTDSRLEADPPIISITPKDGSVVSGEVFTEITTSDAHRIDRVEQSSAPTDFDWRAVDGPEFDEPQLDDAGNRVWYRVDYRFADTTIHPDGTYTVTAIGVDELDNTGREEVQWIVDNTAPTVTIEAPNDAAILSGEEREVVARAFDINGLAHFELVTPDGFIHLADIPAPGEGVVSPTEAEIRVTYNSQREVDGLYAITATAEDVVRNEATDAIEVQVDNAPPSITFRSPRNDAVVDGLINIVVEAQDAAPINAFVVTTPDDVEHAIERAADGTWRADLQWDSTTVFDGRDYPITATVTDSQGNQGAVTILVEVDNIDQGVITGVAHFDSPVAGLVIEARTLDANAERIDLCAQNHDGVCVTDEDGNYEIELVDNYEGPVVIHAIADQNTFAEYVDSATGELAGINDFDLRTMLVNYQPGGRYEGLVFSAASTLTTDWMLATFNPQGDVAQQAQASITAWGEHLCPAANQACDPTTTRPQRYDGADEEFVAQSSGALLGLVQAGLSRRAADLRLRHDEPAFWGIGLLKRFRRDMSDGVIDGRDGEDAIQVDNHPRDHRYLGACSLRSGLAAGMGSFLNKTRLLDIDVIDRNQTEIEKLQMVVYLEGVSTRVERTIWGPIFVGGRLVWDYCEYDGDGPEIIISQPHNDERYGPNGGLDTADWTLRVRGLAEDDSGVGEMWMEFPGEAPLYEELNPSPENYITEIFYEGWPEGRLNFAAIAADLAGNEERVALRPTIDLTPPAITVFTTVIDRFDPFSGEVVYRFDEPAETSAEEPIFTPSPGIVIGIQSNEPLSIFGTDAEYIEWARQGWRYFVHFPLNPGLDRLALNIADLQGNSIRQDIWIVRDADGPTIELVDSGHYQPEDTLQWQGADCAAQRCARIDFDMDEPSIITPIDLQLGQRAVPIAITKFYANWDNAITRAANNPTLNFHWTDELAQAVEVDYRVLTAQPGIEGTCCNGANFDVLADWRPLNARQGDVALRIHPDTIDPNLGLDPNLIYRIEARITNRAGVSATTTALFSVKLIAPPVIAELAAQRWRDDGFGVGSLSFANEDVLMTICNAESASLRRLSDLQVYNPWDFPIRVRGRARASIEQYNRKAWSRSRQNVVSNSACLGNFGDYRAGGADNRCYDEPGDLPNVITERIRVHTERSNITLSAAERDAALPQDGEWYILAPGQNAEMYIQLPSCDIPFLSADINHPGPRPHPPRSAAPHPTERRILERVRRHGNYPRFDLYQPIERVSRLRFEATNIALSLRAPVPNGHSMVWHERWTDSYEIDNPSLHLPEGLEGDD